MSSKYSRPLLGRVKRASGFASEAEAREALDLIHGLPIEEIADLIAGVVARSDRYDRNESGLPEFMFWLAYTGYYDPEVIAQDQQYRIARLLFEHHDPRVQESGLRKLLDLVFPEAREDGSASEKVLRDYRMRNRSRSRSESLETILWGDHRVDDIKFVNLPLKAQLRLLSHLTRLKELDARAS